MHNPVEICIFTSRKAVDRRMGAAYHRGGTVRNMANLGLTPTQHFAATVSRRRLIWGDYLGLFAVPFVLVGLLHVFIGLRPAGFWAAVAPVALLTYAYVLGAAFHHAVAILVSTAQEDVAAATPLATQFLRPLLTVFMAAAVSGA